jgi:hypothetical protein
MTEPTDRPVLVSVAEARRQLDLGLTKIYELIHTGELDTVLVPSKAGASPGKRVGEPGPRGTRKIKQASIDAFIERHSQAATTSPA